MKDLKSSYKTIMDDSFPEEITMTFGNQTLTYRKRSWKINTDGELVEKGLRYGENPGQEAALYEMVNGNLVLGKCEFISAGNSLVSGLSEEQLLQFGKHPGKTNITDIDSCLNILKYLTESTACVIVKHNNPCGVAVGSTQVDTFYRALMGDRIAAFGGCVALNKTIDKATAELIAQNYFEVVVAPDFEGEAIEILKGRKNLRIVQIKDMTGLNSFRSKRFVDFKSLMDGGLIVQQSPLNIINSAADLLPAKCEYKGELFEIERQPKTDEIDDMLFGWSVEQGVTSNSVIYVKDGVTVGIGTGEQDRVGVAEIAVYKAYQKYADKLCFEKYALPYKQLALEVEQGKEDGAKLKEIDEQTQADKAGLVGSCMVSDAFFPFRDGVDVGIAQGITSIIQPGGSIRDFESILACNEADPKVSMMFTGQRCFKH